MATQRFFRAFLLANLALLFAGSLWFRVTSLEHMPEPMGDEAWAGVQVSQWFAGGPKTLLTPSKNLPNPLFDGLLAPLVLIFKPSYWVLRVPAVACGILAIGLTYVLGKRAFDRPTAVIAAASLGVLPIAIIYSRIGWNPSQTPLVSLVALYFALRGRMVATFLAFAVCYIVHPTNLFLAPILLAVFAARVIRTTPVETLKRRWPWIAGAAAGIVVLSLAIGLYLYQSPSVKWIFATYHFGALDWPKFLLRYERMMLGFCNGVPTDTSTILNVGFWTILTTVFVLGSWRLIRDRQWDQLALIAGLLASATAFHVVAGPDGLHPAMPRYGLWMVLPSVLAFACLSRGLLARPDSARQALLRNLQFLALIVLGWTSLDIVKVHWFDFFIASTEGQESLWTLRTESIEPKQRALRLILRDIGRESSSPTTIVAEDWWTYKPIQYLAIRRKDIEVISLEDKNLPSTQFQEFVHQRLGAGGYIFGVVGSRIDAAAKASFPVSDVRAWYVQYGHSPCIVVYRLRKPDDRERTVRELADKDPYYRINAADDLWTHDHQAESITPVLSSIVEDSANPRFARIKAAFLLDIVERDAIAAKSAPRNDAGISIKR